ncbi:MAG: DNA polymerase III subunit delta [Myxococcota bacterium]
MADLHSLLSALSKGSAGDPVYALVGDEPLLIGRAVSALRDATVGDAGVPGFNEDRFAGKETNGAAVAAAASTLPMMADRRFVIVRAVDGMKEADPLVAYIKEPNPSTCLVLTATKLNGSTKLAKALKKGGFRYDHKPLKGHALQDFARAEARRLGHPMDGAAAFALCDAIGEDLSSLGDALERLSLYVGAEQPITAEHVGICVARVRVDSIWALVDAVGMRDRKRALTAASSLLQSREAPLRILAMLARQLRIVARMREGLASGLSPQDAAKAAGAPPFKARDLKESARRFRLDDLRRAFTAIAEADLLLKGSKQPGDVVLEHTIMRLC